MTAALTTTGHKAGKELTMSTSAIVTVRIANFPINAQGFWGEINGTIECRAEITGEFAGGRMVEVRLIDAPLPYEAGEVLVLDRMADGTIGPKELVAA